MPTLEAGRELDALVAEKVMGLIPVGPGEYWNSLVKWRAEHDYYEECPDYSTDIAAAWQVAELFDEMELRHGPSGWLCRLERGDDEHVQSGESLRAETAPLAICRAALAAFETPR